MPKDTCKKRPGLQRGIPYDALCIRGVAVGTAVAEGQQDERGHKADDMLTTYDVSPLLGKMERSTVKNKPAARRGIMRNIAAPSSRKMGADSAKKSATRKVRFLKRGEADKNEPVNAEGRERSIDKHGKQPVRGVSSSLYESLKNMPPITSLQVWQDMTQTWCTNG